MGLTEILLPRTPTSIGVVELDASVRELHTASAKVTRHPVESEQGWQSDVSDHVQIDPLSVQIEGVVTNTPAEWVVFIGPMPQNRAFNAHQDLLYSLLAGELVTIKTSLLEYPNMVIESLQITRDAEKGNALYLNATATMVSLVTLEETEAIRTTEKSTKDHGKKPAGAASGEVSGGAKSFLKKLFF